MKHSKAIQRGKLGRNFYELLDDNRISHEKSSAATMLRVSEIEPRSDQPRKTFEREPLEALAASVSQFGVLQPIVVRESQLLSGTYEILAGERRWRAAKMAGLSEIPAIILDGDDLKAAQIAVIENVQREDLNVVEEAFAYKALIDRFDLTQEQVAAEVGKSRPAIANLLRLHHNKQIVQRNYYYLWSLTYLNGLYFRLIYLDKYRMPRHQYFDCKTQGNYTHKYS